VSLRLCPKEKGRVAMPGQGKAFEGDIVQLCSAYICHHKLSLNMLSLQGGGVSSLQGMRDIQHELSFSRGTSQKTQEITCVSQEHNLYRQCVSVSRITADRANRRWKPWQQVWLQ